MSILTDLIEGKITLGQAGAEVVQWGENLISHDQTLTTATAAVVSDVKQAASVAVAMADTAIGAAILPAAQGVEMALESALATITKGASIPFNGFVSDGIDQMASAIKAEADAWALKAKAALAPPAAATTASTDPAATPVAAAA